MYLRHFALTRMPFETPAHTDELFESNARRGVVFLFISSRMCRIQPSCWLTKQFGTDA